MLVLSADAHAVRLSLPIDDKLSGHQTGYVGPQTGCPNGSRGAGFHPSVAVALPVRDLILSGRRVRQTHGRESDADPAVVLRGAPAERYGVVREVAGIAFDVILETGILVQVLSLWTEEVDRLESAPNPSLVRTTLARGSGCDGRTYAGGFSSEAERDLYGARLLAQEGNGDGARSRAYSAMVDAAKAALLCTGN